MTGRLKTAAGYVLGTILGCCVAFGSREVCDGRQRGRSHRGVRRAAGGESSMRRACSDFPLAATGIFA